jgi:hypothetical protein
VLGWRRFSLHTMAQPFETTFLLFVDMLGFAALVEKEGDYNMRMVIIL